MSVDNMGISWGYPVDNLWITLAFSHRRGLPLPESGRYYHELQL